MKKLWLIYFGLYIITLILSMGILPVDDDYITLRYLKNAKDLDIETPTWLFNCAFLPRGYWRPWEDMLQFFVADNLSLYPYLHHFLNVSLAFGCGALTYKLSQKLCFPPKTSILTIFIGMFFTNNMAGIFAVDSFAIVLATFAGLLSVNIFISNLKYKYFLWILTGFISCFAKEVGFTYFIVAPLVEFLVWTLKQKKITIHTIDYRFWIKRVLVCSIPAVIYLGIYFVGHVYYENYIQSTVQTNVVEEGNDKDAPTQGAVDLITSSQQSYKLTSTTLVKNIFILYFASIYPVDTMSIYYQNKLLLVLSALFSISGLILFFRLFVRRIKKDYIILSIFLAIIVVVSSASLITRAGELSSFASNFFVILLLVFLISKFSFSRLDFALLSIFMVCTLCTDAHKYTTAYVGGHIGEKMGMETIRKTISKPYKVLWIGPNELNLDKAGAAFNKSPFRAYHRGDAAFRAYNYMYPKYMTRKLLNGSEYNQYQVDSIIDAIGAQYDAIWITHDTIVDVINNKRK